MELSNVLILIIQVNETRYRRSFPSVAVPFPILGFITLHELREVFRRLNHQVSEQQITAALRDIDTDHDGKISYEEFVHLLQDV